MFKEDKFENISLSII